MRFLRKKFEESPELARIAPLATYLVLGQLQGEFGPASVFWMYMAKTLVGAWVLWQIRPFVQEMRWKVSWEAVVVGVGVFLLWIGLDGYYPRITDPGAGADPFKQFGGGAAMTWVYVVVHIAGMTIIVPPVEEIFYRSFLYRFFVKIDFRAMPLGQFHALSFFVTSTAFGLMHPDRWLAGILCGLAYQWLVIRKGRLGDAMTAHAITNCLLGTWIVWRGTWSFW
jgi:uncharacterized protein